MTLAIATLTQRERPSHLGWAFKLKWYQWKAVDGI
jgi:hypothetical protein